MTQKTTDFKDTLRQVRLLLAANALVCVVAFGYVIRTLQSDSANLTLWAGLLGLTGITVANIAYLKKYLKKSQRLLSLEEESQHMDTCFKEVHHRVKNNLQTVSSLLNLQLRTTDDPSAGKLIKSSQHRVKSMAMVHEMLYNNNRYTSRLPANTYLSDLANYLIRSFSNSEGSSAVTLDMKIQDIDLNADTLIPLGIFVNEVITNSLKYAFPDGGKGTITIELSSPEKGYYRLFMGDDGVGINPGEREAKEASVGDEFQAVQTRTSSSLGLRLIEKITRQLKGNLMRGSDEKGTWYELEFEESVQGHEL